MFRQAQHERKKKILISVRPELVEGYERQSGEQYKNAHKTKTSHISIIFYYLNVSCWHAYCHKKNRYKKFSVQLP